MVGKTAWQVPAGAATLSSLRFGAAALWRVMPWRGRRDGGAAARHSMASDRAGLAKGCRGKLRSLCVGGRAQTNAVGTWK